VPRRAPTGTVAPMADQPQIADSVLDLVGGTPLVRLGRISAGLPTPVVAKLETTNPGGSVKDRPAIAMIDAAERDGLLRPGGTIVEPTSGNTGVGLAIVAAQRGYRCVFVMTDKVATEKVPLLEAYGAEVVVCPVAVAPEDPRSYYSTAERLVSEIARRVPPRPVLQPGEPLGARARHRPRAVGADRGSHHALRGRRGHRRHHHRGGSGAQGPQPRGADRRRRPRGLGVLGRLGSPVPGRGHRRGLLAHHLRPGGRRRGDRHQRPRLVHDGPAGGARGGPADRRLRRHGGGRGPAGGCGGLTRRPGGRADPGLGPGLPVKGVRRRLDGVAGVPRQRRPDRPGRARGARARRPPAAGLRPPRGAGAPRPSS
jgi:hypothetical protein